ncbi:MAG: SDR family oxidoreductase [Flavobacteriales bacterium]|jgi:NAD(P)H dehydrogenase (quinone)|nr:SDR family oxidoreductase [Flavobacteriales bacterium]
MSQKILITGASGHFGGGVLDHLLHLLPADRLIAMARDPQKLQRFADKGVEARHGDYDDPASLEAAFQGVGTVLLVPGGDLQPGKRPGQHRNVVDAAKRAGVGHILYKGIIHHDEPGHGLLISDHQDTEQMIADSGIKHTFLRDGLYLDVLPMLWGNAPESGAFPYPTATKGLSVVRRADLAEAAAKVIADPALHGTTIELAAGEPVMLSDVAAAIGTTTGKPVQHVPITLDELRTGMVQHGLPGPVADGMTGMARAIAEGVVLATNSRLKEILGREPVAMPAFVRSVLQPADA